MAPARDCSEHTPPWFVGHWRDWHRGHGCAKDDGMPRSENAIVEIAQHERNRSSGFLTDAELRFLRASTTSGDTLRVRAIDELTRRRAAKSAEQYLVEVISETRNALVPARHYLDKILDVPEAQRARAAIQRMLDFATRLEAEIPRLHSVTSEDAPSESEP